MLTRDELEQTYTVLEVARIIKKHPDTVRAMIRANQLDAARIGRTYRVRKSVVEKLIGIEKPLQSSL